MKYYYREHLAGYERVRAEGKRAWHTIHGGKPFDEFPSRGFLEEALPRLNLSAARPEVLEIGCGTGVGACFLAERGFRVDGIDIIPAAIEIAEQVAGERALGIHYEVQDVCDLPLEGKRYDVIVDSYCLQGIVLDEDRARVFAAVRARLRPMGYYLVSTAMFDPGRFREECTIVDADTGVTYNRYGERGVIDAETGIAYVEMDDDPERYEGSVRISGQWYLPSRRHLKPPALRRELEAAGFEVLYQDGEYGGNAICAHAGSGVGLR